MQLLWENGVRHATPHAPTHFLYTARHRNMDISVCIDAYALWTHIIDLHCIRFAMAREGAYKYIIRKTYYPDDPDSIPIVRGHKWYADASVSGELAIIYGHSK